MSLVGLLVVIILVFVLIWAIQVLAKTFQVPDQIRVVIIVLVVVLFVLWVLGALGLFAGPPMFRLR